MSFLDNLIFRQYETNPVIGLSTEDCQTVKYLLNEGLLNCGICNYNFWENAQFKIKEEVFALEMICKRCNKMHFLTEREGNKLQDIMGEIDEIWTNFGQNKCSPY